MTFGYSSSIDVTTLFKSCVKTIHTRNKAIGLTIPPSKILPTPVLSLFFNKAREIQHNIDSHIRLLNEHRKKYMSDNINSMSDVERSYMEKVVSRNINTIEESIRSLEADSGKESGKAISNQCEECKKSVISILRTNYQSVNKIFHDMKHQRKIKQTRKDQLARLDRSTYKNVILKSRSPPVKDQESVSITESVKKSSNQNTDQKNANGFVNSDKSDGDEKSRSATTYFQEEVEAVLCDLDESERQFLEEENKHLINELTSNHEEVKQITRQVVELSRMQDVLTDHVESQAKQIDDIYDSVLHGTDNVQRGNEQVREAMRKDASFRVWIMFFLIVMSCTILFLDWYNP